MWNWKCILEDKNFVCYCDIDSIVDPDADEDGIYPSVECYQSLPFKTVSWMMFFIKNGDIIDKYREHRKVSGLSLEGYETFNNFLCIVELDSENNLYRVIPVDDFDNGGRRLDASAIIDGKPLIKGLKGEWSPIIKGKTHRSVFALYRFIYGRDV